MGINTKSVLALLYAQFQSDVNSPMLLYVYLCNLRTQAQVN